MPKQYFGGVERMMQNKNFNMIVKKFILNEGLVAAIVVGYILGGGCAFIGFMGYFCKIIADLRACFFGIFILIITGALNCLWYCLQKYDRMYGLFNNWEDGCDICKQLIEAKRYDSGKKYNIAITTYFDQKRNISVKDSPLYCPHCGRKLSSFNTPRY